MSKNKAQIIEIAGKKFVAGLQWRTYEDAPEKTVIMEEANVIGADWYCERIRQPELIQCGYSEAVDGSSSKKLFSLAASIADVERNPWLGIYQLSEDLWWFIAVRDNQSILPNGDVIGTKEEVKEAIDAVSGMSDWTYIEGDFEKLEELIKERVKKPSPVKPLFGPSPWIAPLVAISVFAIVGIGVFAWWQGHVKQLEQERRAAQIEAMKAAKAKELAEHSQSELQQTPMAQTVVSACLNVANNLPVSYYGWEPVSVDCTTQSAMVNWKRGKNATVEHLPANADFGNSGNDATQSISFDIKQSGNNLVQDLFLSKQQFMGAMQKYGAQMNMTTPPPPPPPPPNTPPEQIVKPLPSALFTMSTTSIPSDYKWDSIPGLRVTSMHYNGEHWQIQGTIYGRR